MLSAARPTMSRTPLSKPPVVDSAAGTAAALRARRGRAQVKASLREGRRSPLDVLAVASADASSFEAGLRVPEFLGCLRGLGVGKVASTLEALAISDRKRLGFLGRRQRHALSGFLAQRAGSSDPPRELVPIVLAGPSGVGKGTVASGVRSHRPDTFVSISVTTRSPRPGEIDGEHYFFVSEADFDRMIEKSELLEWAVVHGEHRYGTPRQPIADAIARGKPVLLEIDVQGAMNVKEAMPEIRLVFLLPPSWDALVDRLAARGTEDEHQQTRRLATAEHELALAERFDVCVVNDDVSEAVHFVLELMGISQE
jgi:guanylate kinase